MLAVRELNDQPQTLLSPIISTQPTETIVPENLPNPITIVTPILCPPPPQADKQQLQSALKQQATALKEKEFNLHHSNLMTVGTQAAVLAAVNVTMFIEFQPQNFSVEDTWGELEGLVVFVQRLIKFVYYVSICTAMMSNIMVVSNTTVLAVLGTSLALRGPDGSMVVATEGLYSERSLIFKTFGRGLICTVLAAGVCMFLVLRIEASFICFAICMYVPFRPAPTPV